jgi:hypothetical protein
MKEEKLEKLLDELADATAEPVSPHLAETIKQQIPQELSPHRGGRDTVSIIIDLRISKLAAAAAIIITMILFASFFGRQGQEGDGIYNSGKLLFNYFCGDIWADKTNIQAARKIYERIVQTDQEAVYFGDIADPRDKNAVLIQWKLSDGEYRVVFGDLHEETVSAEELIRLQSRMLRKMAQ